MKGLKEKGKGIEREVREVLKELGIELGEGRMKKMEGEWERRMALVSLRNTEEKRKLWEMKKNLRGRAIWIKEDLTWNERKTIWGLRQIAWKEEAKGRRVWIGKGELKIEGKWWRWDEVREELRDKGGRRWETELGMVERREIRRGKPGNEQQGEVEKGEG